MSERARHTGEGVARRKAHQERQRDEREQREEADRAAGTALPPEEGGVELVSADDVLKGVAETGPNYTLLPKRERKAIILSYYTIVHPHGRVTRAHPTYPCLERGRS